MSKFTLFLTMSIRTFLFHNFASFFGQLIIFYWPIHHFVMSNNLFLIIYLTTHHFQLATQNNIFLIWKTHHCINESIDVAYKTKTRVIQESCNKMQRLYWLTNQQKSSKSHLRHKRYVFNAFAQNKAFFVLSCIYWMT